MSLLDLFREKLEGLSISQGILIPGQKPKLTITLKDQVEGLVEYL